MNKLTPTRMRLLKLVFAKSRNSTLKSFTTTRRDFVSLRPPPRKKKSSVSTVSLNAEEFANCGSKNKLNKSSKTRS